jgi:hypothetical protein
MARLGGNPDFGTKYKFDFGRERPLTAQVKAVVYPEIKEKLKKLAQERQCTVPDVIRDALEQYLNEENQEEILVAQG